MSIAMSLYCEMLAERLQNARLLAEALENGRARWFTPSSVGPEQVVVAALSLPGLRTPIPRAASPSRCVDSQSEPAGMGLGLAGLMRMCPLIVMPTPSRWECGPTSLLCSCRANIFLAQLNHGREAKSVHLEDHAEQLTWMDQPPFLD